MERKTSYLFVYLFYSAERFHKKTILMIHFYCLRVFICVLIYSISSYFYCIHCFGYHFVSEISSTISAIIWVSMIVSAAIVVTLPRETGIRTLVASTILRLIFSLSPEPTLWLLGTVTIFLKGIHLVSIMGNHGTLTKTYRQILTDAELVYHLAYLVFCMLGLLMHPFFYSVLVNIKKKSKVFCVNFPVYIFSVV